MTPATLGFGFETRFAVGFGFDAGLAARYGLNTLECTTTSASLSLGRSPVINSSFASTGGTYLNCCSNTLLSRKNSCARGSQAECPQADFQYCDCNSHHFTMFKVASLHSCVPSRFGFICLYVGFQKDLPRNLQCPFQLPNFASSRGPL